MTHRNFQPRKPGLIDEQIQAAKNLRHFATCQARPEVKRDVMVGMFGGRPLTSTGAMLLKEIHMEARMVAQSFGLSYSDQGDFTGVYRGGFY